MIFVRPYETPPLTSGSGHSMNVAVDMHGGGLWQILPPTKTAVSSDPVTNAKAAMAYFAHRYGPVRSTRSW